MNDNDADSPASAAPQPRPSHTLAPRQPSRRSRVTNGSAQIIEGDENSPWARRRYDLVALHVSDLGGADGLSEAQLSLIRRISTLECELERLDGKLSLGQEINLAEYTTTANALRRLIETMGLKRVARDITQSLEAIAEELHARQAAADAEAED
jgi:hypothetical protein